MLEPVVKYLEKEKQRILAAYQKCPGMRSIERVFGVKRQTLSEA